MGGAALVVRVIGSLAIVIGMLFLLAKVANKRMGRSSGTAMKVVAKQGLSKSSAITVITVGSRVLLVGSTDQQVTLLAELDPEELIVDVPEPLEPEQVAANLQPPLAGSLLSYATWKQTIEVLTKAS